MSSPGTGSPGTGSPGTGSPRWATSLDELVRAWLPRQRWFAGKGGADPVVTESGALRLASVHEPATSILDHLIVAEVGTLRATYQVPLTYRPEAAPGLADALIGVLDDGSGPRWVYDAPHDPVFVDAWLHLVADERKVDGAVLDAGASGGARAAGCRQPGGPSLPVGGRARVLSGEQSNTSVIVTGHGDAGPVILKLFRVLADGPNPDVAVTSTLTAAGCTQVPALAGWVEGHWEDPVHGPAHGHLASVSEFLPVSQDAWQAACVAVEQGRAFTAEAAAIGRATAAVHAALATCLPTRDADASAVGQLAGHLADRLAWALDAVTELAPFADAARRAAAAVGDLDVLPPWQRIHGDLHLGQVLDAGDRGWVLLDFEGEPLRPLADRNRLDLPQRDIAGMLRSFDYAARHAVIGTDDDDPRLADAAAWADDASAAFLDAYAAAIGRDPRADAVLLRALELDKALYEVVYESRNRPTWVGLPLAAVRRLLAG